MLPIKVESVSTARGVTVFTDKTAEEYPTADTWTIDDKGALNLVDVSGRPVATYVVAMWFRVVAGIKPPPS